MHQAWLPLLVVVLCEISDKAEHIVQYQVYNNVLYL